LHLCSPVSPVLFRHSLEPKRVFFSAAVFVFPARTFLLCSASSHLYSRLDSSQNLILTGGVGEESVRSTNENEKNSGPGGKQVCRYSFCQSEDHEKALRNRSVQDVRLALRSSVGVVLD